MKTIVNFILDKSGSMETVRDATISGFNEYIQTLKKDDKSEYEFSLTTFNDSYKMDVEEEDIEDVEELDRETYNPNGGTALYDAVCATIKNVKTTNKGKRCKECGHRKDPNKYVVVILTDGQENCSREYTEKDLKKMIEEREEQGNWTFVYLGANQDSYAVAAKYGFSAGNTMNFSHTAGGTTAVFRGMATATSAYACSGDASTTTFLSTVKDDVENTK